MKTQNKETTGHTPGAWGTQPVTNRYETLIRRNAPGSVLIASVHGMEHKENARLIASAPDLLNALELCLTTLERVKPSRPGDSTQGTRDVCNAAIAKAKGNL